MKHAKKRETHKAETVAFLPRASKEDMVAKSQADSVEDGRKSRETYRIAYSQEAIVVDHALRHDSLRRRSNSSGNWDRHHGSWDERLLMMLNVLLLRNRNLSRLLLLGSRLLGTSHYVVVLKRLSRGGDVYRCSCSRQDARAMALCRLRWCFDRLGARLTGSGTQCAAVCCVYCQSGRALLRLGR